jgi:ATP-dependent Clp protease adaptor protein ClpS
MSSTDAATQKKAYTEIKEKTTVPPMYKVLLHNDDYTTKEFVVYLLKSVFHKSLDEAVNLMWHIHRSGYGVCGVYTRDLAETKIKITKEMSREYGYPLKATMEEE